ncbi:MAG: hypothetical protein BECKG1743D_GA0114223_107433, partial [Candidatus Kentron sp. G]
PADVKCLSLLYLYVGRYPRNNASRNNRGICKNRTRFMTRRHKSLNSWAKKRSYYGINEHFEHIFNAVRECEATFAYSSTGKSFFTIGVIIGLLSKETGLTEVSGRHFQVWKAALPSNSRF